MTLIQKLGRCVLTFGVISAISFLPAEAAIIQIQMTGTVNSIGNGAAFWGTAVTPGSPMISTFIYDEDANNVLSSTFQIGSFTFTADSGLSQMTAIDDQNLFETTLDGYTFASHADASGGLTAIDWSGSLLSTDLSLLDVNAGPLFQTHPISAFNAVQQITFSGSAPAPDSDITSVDFVPQTFVVSTVPEPTSIALLVAGLAVVAGIRRRRV